MLTERGYEVRLPSALPPAKVTFEGRELPVATATAPCDAPCWTVEGRTLTTVIRLPRRPVSAPVVVEVAPAEATAAERRTADGYAGRLARLGRAMVTLNGTWPTDWSPESLVAAVQSARRIELDPAAAGREIAALVDALPVIVADIRRMEAPPAVIARALAQLGPDGR